MPVLPRCQKQRSSREDNEQIKAGEVPQSLQDNAKVRAPKDLDARWTRKVKAQINEKGTRGHPLSEEQKARNREKSRTRSRVEHVFAQMSGSMKALHQRRSGMKRNAACLMLTNLVCNMLRFEQIVRLKLNAVA